jgi:hypothetical protein
MLPFYCSPLRSTVKWNFNSSPVIFGHLKMPIRKEVFCGKAVFYVGSIKDYLDRTQKLTRPNALHLFG